MQENEFEKKLQQKLEELKVQPADEVWLKIQAEVATKTRRRRRVLFFFLVAVLFTAGFIIKENTTWFNTTQSVASVQQQENTTTKLPGEKGNANNTSSSTAVSDNQPTVAITTDDNHSATITTVNADAGNTSLVSQIKKQKGTLSLNITAGSVESQQSDVSLNAAKHSYKKIKGKKKASVRTNISSALVDEGVTEATDKPSQASIAEKPVTKETNAANATNEQVQKDVPVNKMVTTDAVKEDIKTTAQQNKSAEKNGKKLWSVRLSLAAGMSATGNSYLSNKSLAQADYTAANPGNIPSAGNLFLPPSSVKNGYGIEAGINVYRRLSAKSKIAAGLSYQLHTTGIQIGSRSDSAAALRQNVFANGSQQSYTNYYHLLSVPVQFSTQLFTIGGADVNLDLGVNFSRLISTNSLQYNLGRLVYYQDNSLFNKNIIGLSASANIHLFPKTKAGFYIGPEFYYSLTPMAAAGMYERSHYKFWGIRLQKNLKK